MDNVVQVKGDTNDIDSMREALTGIDTLFLLIPLWPMSLRARCSCLISRWR